MEKDHHIYMHDEAILAMATRTIHSLELNVANTEEISEMCNTNTADTK